MLMSQCRQLSPSHPPLHTPPTLTPTSTNHPLPPLQQASSLTVVSSPPLSPCLTPSCMSFYNSPNTELSFLMHTTRKPFLRPPAFLSLALSFFSAFFSCTATLFLISPVFFIHSFSPNVFFPCTRPLNLSFIFHHFSFT